MTKTIKELIAITPLKLNDGPFDKNFTYYSKIFQECEKFYEVRYCVKRDSYYGKVTNLDEVVKCHEVEPITRIEYKRLDRNKLYV